MQGGSSESGRRNAVRRRSGQARTCCAYSSGCFSRASGFLEGQRLTLAWSPRAMAAIPLLLSSTVIFLCLPALSAPCRHVAVTHDCPANRAHGQLVHQIVGTHLGLKAGLTGESPAQGVHWLALARYTATQNTVHYITSRRELLDLAVQGNGLAPNDETSGFLSRKLHLHRNPARRIRATHCGC